MKPFLAELSGTFVLVFAGTGSIVLNDMNDGAVTDAGVALTFGLAVLAMICLVGGISGAHLNPAVTLGFTAVGRLPARRVPLYLLAQCAGALLASLALRELCPEHRTLGATLPAGPPIQSFFLETLLAWLLVFVILRVSAGARQKGSLAGVVIGSVVALEAFLAGPVSGASMNPARSLGPALVSGHLEHLWVYLTAPVQGALLAAATCAAVNRLRAYPDNRSRRVASAAGLDARSDDETY